MAYKSLQITIDMRFRLCKRISNLILIPYNTIYVCSKAIQDAKLFPTYTFTKRAKEVSNLWFSRMRAEDI